jgi:hypothetical protein
MKGSSLVDDRSKYRWQMTKFDGMNFKGSGDFEGKKKTESTVQWIISTFSPSEIRESPLLERLWMRLHVCG